MRPGRYCAMAGLRGKRRSNDLHPFEPRLGKATILRERLARVARMNSAAGRGYHNSAAGAACASAQRSSVARPSRQKGRCSTPPAAAPPPPQTPATGQELKPEGPTYYEAWKAKQEQREAAAAAAGCVSPINSATQYPLEPSVAITRSRRAAAMIKPPTNGAL
jgi:hypothetical protein